MSFWGKVVGGVVGFMVGGPAGAVIGATAGHTIIDQPAETKEQLAEAKTLAEQQTKKQVELREREIGEYAELTEAQMKLQAGATTISTLANLITERESPAPQVFTLPAAKTYTRVEQLNMAIDKFLRG